MGNAGLPPSVEAVVSLASLCPFTADVQRKSTAAASATNLGGQVLTWTTVYDDLSVSGPQQPSGSTRLEAMRRNMEVSHTFYTPTVVALQTGDRLSYGGAYYHVQWFADMGGQGRAYAIHTIKVS